MPIEKKTGNVEDNKLVYGGKKYRVQAASARGIGPFRSLTAGKHFL